jgi:hypothetical protein
MIDINKQLDEIIAKQFKDITPILNQVEEGAQKEFLINSLNDIRNKRTLDISTFIENFAKIKGEKVDIESLKEKVKNYNHAS